MALVFVRRLAVQTSAPAMTNGILCRCIVYYERNGFMNKYQAMNDNEVLARLLPVAVDMLKAGCAFAKADNPQAYAALTPFIESASPQLVITLGDCVTVSGLLVDSEGEPIAQVFELSAEKFHQGIH
jgi:hypothetical protein